MFHCILNYNNPRIAHKLRCILADFVREQWDFPMPSLGMTVGELVGASGLSKEGYLKSIVQSSYWGSDIELYLLSWLLNQTFQVYVDAGNFGSFFAVMNQESQSWDCCIMIRIMI